MIYKEDFKKTGKRIVKCGWCVIEKDAFNFLYNKYHDKLKEIMTEDDFDSLQELVVSIRAEARDNFDDILFMHDENKNKDMEINLPSWCKLYK